MRGAALARPPAAMLCKSLTGILSASLRAHSTAVLRALPKTVFCIWVMTHSGKILFFRIVPASAPVCRCVPGRMGKSYQPNSGIQPCQNSGQWVLPLKGALKAVASRQQGPGRRKICFSHYALAFFPGARYMQPSYFAEQAFSTHGLPAEGGDVLARSFS